MLLFLPFVGFCQDAQTRSNSYYGQENKKDSKWLMISGGVSYQKQVFGELGMMYATDVGSRYLDGPRYIAIIIGPKISSEFNFKFNHFIIGPKISYEADIWLGYLLMGTRLNVIDYTDFKQNDFRFTPEIGLSFLSFVDLFYGYNIPLSSTRADFAGTNRITLTISFGPRAFHDED